VHEHLEAFLGAAAVRTDGVGLPRFIEREFRAFLRCGLLVHGFLRVRCDDCAFERLVPLSCNGRAYYLSVGTKPDCEDDAAVCAPHPQYPSIPGYWNPLPDFTTVQQDGQLGNIQLVANFFAAPGTARCRPSRGSFPTAM